MIALPTLTILIGSVGDAVSDFSNSAVKAIGEHTGRLVDYLKSLGKKDTNTPDSLSLEEIQSHTLETLAHHEARKALERHLPPAEDAKAHELRDRRAAATAGFAYRPYMVIKEIKKVFSHIEESPAKKYTFQEWAWILRLLDEDESDPDGHRVPGHPEHAELEPRGPIREKKEHAWSWMGQESPLMSMDCEAKWVLTRLVEVLELELKERGDREVLEKCGGRHHHLVE